MQGLRRPSSLAHIGNGRPRRAYGSMPGSRPLGSWIAALAQKERGTNPDSRPCETRTQQLGQIERAVRSSGCVLGGGDRRARACSHCVTVQRRFSMQPSWLARFACLARCRRGCSEQYPDLPFVHRGKMSFTLEAAQGGRTFIASLLFICNQHGDAHHHGS
jgi:hypothetical protein